MRSIPVYSQRGGPCAAVIGHGRHLMIYSCEGDFFHILFSHHRASDTHTHTHRGLAPSSPRLPCCRQAQVILKQRRDTRKRKKVKPSSSLPPPVCVWHSFAHSPFPHSTRRTCSAWLLISGVKKNAECCPWLICGLKFSPAHPHQAELCQRIGDWRPDAVWSTSSNPTAEQGEKLEKLQMRTCTFLFSRGFKDYS